MCVCVRQKAKVMCSDFSKSKVYFVSSESAKMSLKMKISYSRRKNTKNRHSLIQREKRQNIVEVTPTEPSSGPAEVSEFQWHNKSGVLEDELKLLIYVPVYEI